MLPLNGQLLVGPRHADDSLVDIGTILPHKGDANRESAPHVFCDGLSDDLLSAVRVRPPGVQDLPAALQFDMGPGGVVAGTPESHERLSRLSAPAWRRKLIGDLYAEVLSLRVYHDDRTPRGHRLAESVLSCQFGAIDARSQGEPNLGQTRCIGRE